MIKINRTNKESRWDTQKTGRFYRRPSVWYNPKLTTNEHKMKIRKYIISWMVSFEWISMTLLRFIPSRHLRIWILRLMGARIGKKVSIFASVKIRCPKKLSIGDGCSIGPGVLLDARSGLSIGNNVTLAQDSIIWTLHHDINSPLFQAKGASVRIDDYSWICSRAIVLPGANVSYGSVVATGAVLTKSIESKYSVMGGIPAKCIGVRTCVEFKYCPYMNLHIV